VLATILFRVFSLPGVSHGFEILYITLVKEHKLRVFENKMLRRIFETSKLFGQIKLLNEEILT